MNANTRFLKWCSVALAAVAFSAACTIPDTQPEAPIAPPVTPTPGQPATPPAPATAASSEIEKPETPVADEPIPAHTVKVRCAYWHKPEKAADWYFLVNGNYRRYQLFEMNFPNALTLETDAAGNIPVFRKVGNEFVPFFSLKTAGMADFAVVVLPGFDAGAPDISRIRLFDLSDKNFPIGSLQIVNWSDNALVGELNFTDDSGAHVRTERVMLECNSSSFSAPVSGARNVCKLSFFRDKDSQNAFYSSALVIHGNNRTMLFVLPSENAATPENFDFRICKIR